MTKKANTTMRTLAKTLRGAAALALVLSTASCTDDDPDDDGMGMGSGSGSGSGSATFHQIEQLARPAINEALLITEAFNAGYNATAPSFAGVPDATLGAVVTEAKGTLQALYLGACLLNGLAGVTADAGVHPAAMRCHAIGTAIWQADGITLTEASKTAAKAYADKVFAQFIPDVLRVDTSVASNYLTPCGDLDTAPLLCGGRFVSDDTVDVTYNYLLNGAANYLSPGDGGALDQQIIALTSDGVTYSKDAAKNVDALQKPDATNGQQGHPDVSNTFPYSAAPY